MVGGGNTLRQTLTLEGDFEFSQGDDVLIAQGDFTAKAEPFNPPVRVRVAAASGADWTYLDPGFELLVGDFVLVPFGHDNKLVPGVVSARGDGGYSGPLKAVKDVLIPASDA